MTVCTLSSPSLRFSFSPILMSFPTKKDGPADRPMLPPIRDLFRGI